MNDTHSHLDPMKTRIYINGKKTYVYAGGYAKIAKFIKDTKKSNPNTLVLHAGDALQGTLYYTLFNGKADVETLNHMDIDAMVIGNHEFDKNATTFAKNFAIFAKFPIISCDINASKNTLLKNIIKPYIIKTVNNEKIAIIGDSINSSVISHPGPTISFSDYIKSAKHYIKEVEKQGINKIILLTHLGYKKDIILATKIPDIDIIVGGHSHTLLGDFSNIGLKSSGPYPTVIKHDSSKTLIVTDYKYAEMIGNLDVIFDKNGKIIGYKGSPILLLSDKFYRKNSSGEKTEVNKSVKNKIIHFISLQNNIKIESDDLTVKNIIKKFKPQVNKLMHKVIGYSPQTLKHIRLPNKLVPNGSEIAPLVAKAIYEKANKIEKCDFALENAGNIRMSLQKGNITIGEIYTLLPFNNTIVIVKLKGSIIKSMLENAINRALIQKTNTGAFPYMFNAKIIIDISKTKGKRITSFKIQENGKWTDLNLNKEYKLVTNSYIAKGGDYYKEMKKASYKYDSGFMETETFIDYVKKGTLNKLPSNETPVILK
jgi:5'-nucleotidase